MDNYLIINTNYRFNIRDKQYFKLKTKRGEKQ
jgi:hypothetical protein